MIRFFDTLRQSLPLLIAAAVLALPADVAAFDGGGRGARIERRVHNRLDVQLDGADTSVQRIPLAGWVTTDLLAYRFRLVALDANGIAVVLPASTALMVRVETGTGSSQVRLSPESWDFALPRPFAIRLGAGDALAILFTTTDLAAVGIELSVSIDFEPINRLQTRVPLAVNHAQPRPAMIGEATWEWKPTTDGRVLAMAGLPLDRAEGITFVDVESGETLWSSTVRALTPGATIVAGSVVRLGVPVTAGRTYRLIVTFTGTSPREARGRAVAAMMLPAPTP